MKAVVIYDLKFCIEDSEKIATFLVGGKKFKIILFSTRVANNPKFDDKELDEYMDDFLELYKPILEKVFMIDTCNNYNFSNYHFYNAVNIISVHPVQLDFYRKCIRGEYHLIKGLL